MLWWSWQRQVTVPLLGGTQKLLLLDWDDPRLDVVSLFLVAGAGVDGLIWIVVLSLVSSTAQIEGIMAMFDKKGLSPRLPAQTWASLASTFPTLLNGGTIYELRSNQHRKKAYSWYASGSGLYDAYLVHLVFRWLAKRSISAFPNWPKRDLTTVFCKNHSLLSSKRRDRRSAVAFLSADTWDAVIQMSCFLVQCQMTSASLNATAVVLNPVSTTHVVWFYLWRKLSSTKRELATQGSLCDIYFLYNSIYLRLLSLDFEPSKLASEKDERLKDGNLMGAKELKMFFILRFNLFAVSS